MPLHPPWTYPLTPGPVGAAGFSDPPAGEQLAVPTLDFLFPNGTACTAVLQAAVLFAGSDDRDLDLRMRVPRIPPVLVFWGALAVTQ